MTLAEIITVLQLSVGPAILISGNGLILLSMTNRFGRIIDRSRLLSKEYRDHPSSDNKRITGQLDILQERAELLRTAILFITSSLLLAALLIIVLFLSSLFDFQFNEAPIIVLLFCLCMVCVICGLIDFIRELNLSLKALKLEIER